MASLTKQGALSPLNKQLLRSWWRKVIAAHPKANDFEEMTMPRTEKCVFGIPLTQSIVYAYSRISYYDGEEECCGMIPIIVAKCGSYLKNEGLHTDGIFRLCGSARRIRMLQTIFDSPEQYGSRLDWHGFTVHDAANIMKRFLTALPEPVIPSCFYRSFLDSMNANYSSTDGKVNRYRDLIESLPIVHQYLLLYLLDMLSLFASNKEYTRMETPCLASVFAPGMLSHPDDRLNPESYHETQRVIQFLVQYQACFSMPGSPLADAPTRNQEQIPCRGTTTSAPPILPPDEMMKGPGHPTPRTESQNAATIPTLSSHLHGMYNVPCGSFSGLVLDSLTNGDYLPSRVDESLYNLRRSKTAPSKRKFYGEHELPQTVQVSRGSSQRTHHGGKSNNWRRSLRRITPRLQEDES